jgi:hypothetical protein
MLNLVQFLLEGGDYMVNQGTVVALQVYEYPVSRSRLQIHIKWVSKTCHTPIFMGIVWENPGV